MPTLDWIGKKAVVEHHKQVPFHLLKSNDALSVGESGSGNLLVQGDNLVALKALLPYYAGQVKCIYIDPPYNTGVDERGENGKRTGWIYNDNVDSPEIREWLSRVVGPEAEDLSRHDKWLCMMYPRLSLLHEFLRDDGVIFASIDEVEYANLRLLFDEIFGITNRVGTIIWDNATDNNPTNIAIEHEYILCYARNKSRLSPIWKSQNLAVKEKLLQVGDEFVERFTDQKKRQEAYTKWFRENKFHLWPFDRYKYIDDDGIYTGSQSVHNPGKEGYRYDIIHPVTGKPCKQPMMGYRFPPDTLERLKSEGRLLFGEDETKLIELKVYVRDYRAKLSSLFKLDGRIGTNEIKEIFPDDKRPFDFPKPTLLIEELLSFSTSGDDLILDSFSGSGTTGHAVLKLNKSDGQRRRFILTEMNAKIAREITAVRIQRVAEGYVNTKGVAIPGFGSGFRYCELGDPLFNSAGHIGTSVSFKDLAHHVFFIAMGEPLPRDADPKTPLLGVTNGVAVYLLYNGIMGDKSVNGGNVLTREILASLPRHEGTRIIYGNGCQISPERVRRENIIFRQVPYEVRAS
ncbi:site-specific DNA-methyltransferase [candidate division WS5 bacterium]|uniref:Site-specific DNA-methyltransferase n=1 Tax=candidate division WS5 bacterium TaxID=2093353 RepID=A0A419DCT3_9BACT|nr:MAG: site-specific DNA-methyltransferase [candidate division WS5 bacterium]